MLIIALVLAVIGLAALVTAVVTSNEFIAWVCIAASVLGVLLLIIDAIRERQRREAGVEDAEAGVAEGAVDSGTAEDTYQTFDTDYPDDDEAAPVVEEPGESADLAEAETVEGADEAEAEFVGNADDGEAVETVEGSEEPIEAVEEEADSTVVEDGPEAPDVSSEESDTAAETHSGSEAEPEIVEETDGAVDEGDEAQKNAD